MNHAIRSINLAALATIFPIAAGAQFTSFTDNFSAGSTLNGPSVPGETPSGTVISTSYDLAASKAATTGPTMAPGDLELTLNGPTISGFVEAQALFSPFPIMLFNDGYINLTYTFTDTGGSLLAGGPGSSLFDGLYNSGGSAPVAGALNNSGLNSTTGSSYATGNAANWQGYVGRFEASGGMNQIDTRPLQNGMGTTSANQDLIGNKFGTGAYANPLGVALSQSASSLLLGSGSEYTVSLQLNLNAGILTIDHTLYAGAGTGGSVLATQEATASGANLVATAFDGFAIGVRNEGNSLNPTMDISQITITDNEGPVGPAPEPGTLTLLAFGAMAVSGLYRHARKGKGQ